MNWLAEWGFSAFIEFGGINILFDTGFSDVYRHNAVLADMDLEKTDYVALSHFHRDHTRGLLFHGFKSRIVATTSSYINHRANYRLAVDIWTGTTRTTN